jgi:hypothetical protein
MEPAPNRRSLADVMVSLTMTCVAIALIRLLTHATYYAPRVQLLFCFAGVIAATLAATATCVVGWRRGLRWAAAVFLTVLALLGPWELLLLLRFQR